MGVIDVPAPPCGTEECADLLEHLATAIEHRDIIATAKGLLMAHTGMSSRDAFETLRQASRRENTKLWMIAERIVSDFESRGRAPESE